MKKISKIVAFVCLITMLMIVIPSSFANDLDSVNATVSDINTKEVIASDDSNNADLSIQESDINNDGVIGSGVDVTDGISVDSDDITVNEGEGKITGTLYYTGSLSGDTYYCGGDKTELLYSYTGNDNQEHSGSIWADGDDASFELDLSTLQGLTVRDNPYTITISCEDENYEWMCEAFPDPVDISVKVVNGGADPQVNPSLYVATNGSDDNNGSIESPFASVSKAVSIASATDKEYDIFVNKGTYTITSPISVKKLNIIGLGDVIFDMAKSTYCFDASGNFAVSNITFINGYNVESNGAGAIKSTSTAGRKVTVTNCTFINCTGYSGGAITTYYGGNADLSVVNSTFINCIANYYGGAIAVSYSKTADITGSSFINCSAKNGGAIYFANTNGNSNVNYCVFINNTASNVNNDIQSKGLINANYNYWGNNTKLVNASDNIKVDNWVVLTIDYDVSNVLVGNKVVFTFDLTKDNNGDLLEKTIPEVTINLNSELGEFDNNTVTTNSKATRTYSAISEGSEVITVNLTSKEREIKFNVFANMIYVATNGSDTTGTGIKTNPYKTLEKALTKLSDEINAIYMFNGIYNEKDLEISKSATIIGESRDGVIIEANREGRIFVIDTAGINVNIKSLTLENGKPDYENDDFMVAGKGGAIYVGSGNLYLNDVNVYNSSSAAGGAIAEEGGVSSSLTIENSLFNSNCLDSDSSYYDIVSGGAIYSDGNLKVINTTFTNNDATTDGGAIFVGSSATIINSEFKNNGAKNGGAIGIEAYDSSNILISNNVFDSNSANKGGAISSKMSKLTNISNNEFKLNNGGAIYAEGLKTNDIIADNTFTNNDKGALYIKDATINLSNNIMNNGQIFYESGMLSSVKLTYLENSTITAIGGNNVDLTALLTDDSNNVIAGANISFTIDGKQIGSGITDNKGIATLTYTTNNTIATYIISGNFKGSNQITIKNAILEVSKYYWFINETGYFTLQEAVDASVEGDVITALPGSYTYSEIAIGDRINKIYKNVTIKADKLGDIILSGRDGRLFNIASKNAYNATHRDSSLTLVNIIVRDSSDEYGGAIYNDGYLTLIGCYLTNNTATNDQSASKWHGGAIMGWGDLKIYNTIFEDNHALAGAAICTEVLSSTKSVYIENTTFINNKASAEGGSIYIAGYGEYYTINNCSFIDNVASAGGAIFAYANLTVENTIFTNNKATNTGGAIYSTNKDLNLNNITIQNSSAKYGGALYLQQNSGATWVDGVKYPWNNVFYITNSKFINNKAWYDKDFDMSGQGGVIFVGYNTLATGFIDNCTFINSTAEDKGGVLINYVSNVSIANSKIINANASCGGAIYNEGYYNEDQGIEYTGNMIIDNCSFENVFGETIYNSNYLANMELNNSKFDKIDLLLQNGGNVYVSNNTVINTHEGIVINNTARLSLKNNSFNCNGSAIFNNKLILTDTYLVVLDNKTVYASAGEIINLTAILYDDNKNIIVPGDVVFKVDANNLTATLNNKTGLFSTQYSNNIGGDYLVSAIYQSNSKISVTYLNGTISIDKSTPDVNVIFNNESSFGEDIKVNFEINADATGNVVFTIGNVTKRADIVNGRANVIFSGVTLGEHTLSVYYTGDNRYTSFTGNYGLSVVDKSTPDVNVIFNNESSFGEDIKVNFEINADATGNVVFTIGNVTKRADIVNGKANVTFSDVTLGEHTLSVYYTGDNEYTSFTGNYNLSVVKSGVANLIVSDLEKFFGGSEKLEAILTDAMGNPIVNGTIIFTINGNNYVRYTNTNGSASMAINLNAGVYDVTTKFNATSDSVSVNSTVVVKSTVAGENIVKMFRNGTQYYALFLDSNGNALINTTVKFNINGVMYERKTNESGIAKLNINLDAGNYVITNYNTATGEENSNNITVKSLFADNHELVKYYKNESQYSIKVVGKDGRVVANQEVTFNINGVFYKRTTDENGIATLKINLNPGNYIITTEYEGCRVSNNITVKPTLVTNDLSMNYKDGSKYNVTVLDNQGKPLTNQNVRFNVNGVFYNKTTDSNGVASLDINLMKGKYIITSMWNDYQVGNNIIIK